MPRASRRDDTPSQAVLRFVGDLLASPSSQGAKDLLGFPEETAKPGCDLLSSILRTLTHARVATAKPGVYCDTVHALYQWTVHHPSAPDIDQSVAADSVLSQELFVAVFTANDVSPVLEKASLGIRYWRYRSDVYAILSRCLEPIQGVSTDQLQLLRRLFESFFPSDSVSPLRSDLESIQPQMQAAFETQSDLNEISRLFQTMASFVERSVIQHSSVFEAYCTQSLGVLQGLAGLSLKWVAGSYLTQQCEQMNTSLCYMARLILEKLIQNNQSSSHNMEEMLRQMELVGGGVELIHGMDKRMCKKLRTQVFGAFRGVLLLVLSLPQSSNLKQEVTQLLVMQMNKTTAVLSQHLEPSAEADEKEVLLFELMSLHCEFRTALATRPRAEAFLEAIHVTMPTLVHRLSTASPNPLDRRLIDAQLVFLSKMTMPVPTTLPRAAVADNTDLIPKVLEMLVMAKFFRMMVQKWPVERQEEVERCRAVQPTLRLGLNLILNILHRDQSPVSRDIICNIFSQHLEAFQSSLKMGQRGQRWNPSPSDAEIAKLIERMIQNSTIHTTNMLMSQVASLLPSTVRRM